MRKARRSLHAHACTCMRLHKPEQYSPCSESARDQLRWLSAPVDRREPAGGTGEATEPARSDRLQRKAHEGAPRACWGAIGLQAALALAACLQRAQQQSNQSAFAPPLMPT